MQDREHYQQKMREQLDTWGIDLAKMKARAKSTSDEVRNEMREHIDSLEVKLSEARTRLHELGETTDEAWGSVKDGVESAWASLKRGFHDASEKFRN